MALGIHSSSPSFNMVELDLMVSRDASKGSVILYNANGSRTLPATDGETPSSCCSLREKEHT